MKAVLLDLGDTLVYMARPWDDVFTENLQALYKYLIKFGIGVDPHKFANTFTRIFNDASDRADLFRVEIPMEVIIAKALKKSGMRPTERTVSDAVVEFFGPEIEAWQPFPDATSTLNSLEEDGYVMGLVSNAKSDWAVRAILRRREFDHFFRAIVTSAALKIRKPRAEIFRHTLDEMQIVPSDAVFIGDSIQADVAGANHVGIRSIHVKRKPVEEDAFAQPNASVTSLAEAYEVITQWNNGSSKS